jgi:glucose-6-phosphate 1-dehydrogenase
MDETKEEQNLIDVARASATAHDIETPYQSCLFEGVPEPLAMVIIGASGDLAARKLVPALYNLFLKNALHESFYILGCSRTSWSDDVFREKMRGALQGTSDLDLTKWSRFVSHLHYRTIQYDETSAFLSLASELNDLDQRYHTAGNRIFYLAIPPSLYAATAQMLGQAGLSSEGGEKAGWSRIVVEKPFGRDLESAIELDRALHGHFREDQIFRIDHYLAKETVQNILMFRFANAIFEPIWNRRYIDYVRIMAAESLGVGHRAGYYEQSGVLRDMFQNHMMQLLSLVAMEPPSLFEADRVRDEKVKVYRSLRPFPVGNLQEAIVLGQYSAGTIEGEAVPAYREEPGVSRDSLIPTFAMLRVFVDNWRWQGVPFCLTSGKGLKKKLTEIAIQFKEVPHSMFRQVLGEHITANRIILGIYPDEEITLTFQTKNPGARLCLRSVEMDFLYHQDYTGPVLDAYEKVLLDCIQGDHMLFWRQDAVELCWSFLTPILRECETCGDRAQMLYFYEAGSWGPEAGRRFLRTTGQDL